MLPIWSCVGNTHHLVFDLFQVVKIIADIAIIGDIFLLRLLGDYEHDRRFEKDFGGCEVMHFLISKTFPHLIKFYSQHHGIHRIYPSSCLRIKLGLMSRPLEFSAAKNGRLLAENRIPLESCRSSGNVPLAFDFCWFCFFKPLRE